MSNEAVFVTAIRNILTREPLNIDCDGSDTCPAEDHIHGCYNDQPCEHYS